MMRRERRNQKGFTVVEFLIATAVFSSVLLVCSYAVVHIGRMYFKGSLTSRTQDTSRRVGEDIAQAIQFSAGGTAPRNGGSGSLLSWCIGTIQYSYATDRALGNTGHVLWKSRIPATDSDCTPCDLTQQTPCGAGEELLGDRMRIPRFNLTTNAASAMTTVDLVISYGESADMFETGSNFTICKGINASGDFCAVSAYYTIVGRRL